MARGLRHQHRRNSNKQSFQILPYRLPSTRALPNLFNSFMVALFYRENRNCSQSSSTYCC
eukprot:4303864-Ditylum_brightwellii.AAC.1